MSDQTPISDQPPAMEAESPWTRPTLTLLGDVKDLVRGHGKSGPNDDNDPFQTSKSGGG